MNHPAGATELSTSHEAARYVVQSGLQGDQQAAAASAVKRHPGLTSLELAQETSLCRYVLARRLPELAETGRVWRGPKPCSVSGRSACTWWPVAPGENMTLGL
ncbi:winged helix-turn-helix domain-containing protein [Stenotrophomonas pavanii]